MTVAPSRPLTLPALAELVREVAADAGLWRPLLRVPEHERWWTRLITDPDVDVWLLSWLPGQTTELHDHGGSSAAFTVAEGLLHEQRRSRSGATTSYLHAPGSTTWVAPTVVHDVTGGGTGLAVSIHAYSPPLRRMTYYDAALRPVRSVATSEPEEELSR